MTRSLGRVALVLAAVALLLRSSSATADNDAVVNIGAANHVNDELTPLLSSLITSSYFRYVKMDLTKDCPFWRDDGKCMNKDCVVQVMDEGEVRTEAPFMYHDVNLGDVTFAAARPLGGVNSIFTKCEFSKDFCVLEDEHSLNGVYIDLVDNPERFTGYSGVSANNIWSAIYDENCFDVPTQLTAQATLDANVCLEKQTFYRIISGLHASISIHICSQYLNKITGQWVRHPGCYWSRVGNFPERVDNVYFVHAMLLRAVAKMSPLLASIDVCTGRPTEDVRVQDTLDQIVKHAQSSQWFDETALFRGPGARTLVEEVRTKFRNVSRIMDCVSCQKCRLWGKTQVTGLGTALKVLFGVDPRVLNGEITPARPVLSRYEVVALFNTLNRFVESVQDIRAFEADRAATEAARQREVSKEEKPAVRSPVPAVGSKPATEQINRKPRPETVADSVVDGDATSPVGNADDATSKNEDEDDVDLRLWKYLASALTAAPFVFGALYGYRNGTKPPARGQYDHALPRSSRLSRPRSGPNTTDRNGYESGSELRSGPTSGAHAEDDSDTDDALDQFVNGLHRPRGSDTDDEFDSDDPAGGYSSSGLSDAAPESPVTPASAASSVAAARRASISSNPTSGSPTRSAAPSSERGMFELARMKELRREGGYEGSVEASETDDATGAPSAVDAPRLASGHKSNGARRRRGRRD